MRNLQVPNCEPFQNAPTLDDMSEHWGSPQNLSTTLRPSMIVDAPSSPGYEPPTIGGLSTSAGSLAVMLGSHVDAPPLSPLSEVSQSPFGRSFAESSFCDTKDSKDSKTSEDEDGGDGYQFTSQDSRMMLLGMLEKLVSVVDEWFGICMDMPICTMFH